MTRIDFTGREIATWRKEAINDYIEALEDKVGRQATQIERLKRQLKEKKND